MWWLIKNQPKSEAWKKHSSYWGSKSRGRPHKNSSDDERCRYAKKYKRRRKANGSSSKRGLEQSVCWPDCSKHCRIFHQRQLICNRLRHACNRPQENRQIKFHVQKKSESLWNGGSIWLRVSRRLAQKVEPENSKLSDLDPETPATVEKVMLISALNGLPAYLAYTRTTRVKRPEHSFKLFG
ncbi:uncharacterized protein LOC127241400 isoform X2 [Andrographis paniculata]|uniref:uncharacterized protein LOC127241400 isoform X2 n=1 Tax=Andrographis paniculata TaxID=175694 RepID=UPI0021E788DC|nr:uncharacterized protein LOC127241400 isoform X2 [Andrographis paniculata]